MVIRTKPREVYLQNLPLDDCSQDQLDSWLAGWGKVKHFRILPEISDAYNHAYVCFAEHAAASQCLEANPADVAYDHDIMATWWHELSPNIQMAYLREDPEDTLALPADLLDSSASPPRTPPRPRRVASRLVAAHRDELGTDSDRIAGVKEAHVAPKASPRAVYLERGLIESHLGTADDFSAFQQEEPGTDLDRIAGAAKSHVARKPSPYAALLKRKLMESHRDTAEDFSASHHDEPGPDLDKIAGIAEAHVAAKASPRAAFLKRKLMESRRGTAEDCSASHHDGPGTDSNRIAGIAEAHVAAKASPRAAISKRKVVGRHPGTAEVASKTSTGSQQRTPASCPPSEAATWLAELRDGMGSEFKVLCDSLQRSSRACEWCAQSSTAASGSEIHCLLGPRAFPERRFKNRDGAGVVAIAAHGSGNSKKIFVCLVTAHSGSLGFPKGGKKAAETPEACAFREWREETGLPSERLEIVRGQIIIDTFGCHYFLATWSDSEVGASASPRLLANEACSWIPPEDPHDEKPVRKAEWMDVHQALHHADLTIQRKALLWSSLNMLAQQRMHKGERCADAPWPSLRQGAGAHSRSPGQNRNLEEGQPCESLQLQLLAKPSAASSRICIQNAEQNLSSVRMERTATVPSSGSGLLSPSSRKRKLDSSAARATLLKSDRHIYIDDPMPKSAPQRMGKPSKKTFLPVGSQPQAKPRPKVRRS